MDHFWQPDLVELAHDAYSRRINKGVNYLLTVIDVLSRYAWVVPLKTKSAQAVRRALETIFVTPQRWPNYLTTDEGKEFYNSYVKNLLTKYKVHHFSVYSRMKCSLSERFNRTLKEKIYRYMIANITRKFIDVVPSLVSRYAWVVPLKTKSAQAVRRALETIFVTPQRWPNYLTTDEGNEFYNSYVKNLLTKYKVHHFSVNTKCITLACTVV